MNLFIKGLIFLLGLAALLFATYSQGQAVGGDINAVQMTAPWWLKLLTENISNYPTLAAWVFAMLSGINMILRGLSEILGFVAKKTESKTDDKIFSWVHKASYWSSHIVGWFGVGKPKMVEKVVKK